MNIKTGKKRGRKPREGAMALIFAGGMGRRMRPSAVPKQFLDLYGKPVIVRTLEVFEGHPDVEGIVVVCVEGWIDHLRKLVKRFHVKKVRSIVPGGETGQLSIREGLLELHRLGVGNKTFVMIHDGVRPLVDADDLSRNLEAARIRGGAVTTGPAVETIAVVGEDGLVTELVPRERCRLARAPQTYRLGDLLAVHEKAFQAGHTDYIDTLTLMRDAGFVALAVEGPAENIKITTPQDFLLFKQIVETREAQRGWVL